MQQISLAAEGPQVSVDQIIQFLKGTFTEMIKNELVSNVINYNEVFSHSCDGIPECLLSEVMQSKVMVKIDAMFSEIK